MTLIKDMLKQGRTFSFEFFPPKNDGERDILAQTLRNLESLSPSFVSVTYRGGRSSRKLTHDLVVGIKNTTSITPMAHLICVDHTRLELAEILVDLRKGGIENLMALGGDPPETPEVEYGELRFASELVELARAIGGFSIGVAVQPIGHPNSPDLASDRKYLARKLELADFGVTQFFFKPQEYFSVVEDLSKLGINKPVLPGIMPVTHLSSIESMKKMGAQVPDEMVQKLESAYQSAPDSQKAQEVRKCGIEIATELCSKLLEGGAPGLHFYTLNRSKATREIYDQLGLKDLSQN